jgi:hypothetical protein
MSAGRARNGVLQTAHCLVSVVMVASPVLHGRSCLLAFIQQATQLAFATKMHG